MKKLTGLVVSLALLVIAVEVILNAPDLVAARAQVNQAQADRIRVETQARAQAAEHDAQVAQEVKPAEVAGRVVAYLGLGCALAVAAVGLALALVKRAMTRAAALYPNEAGQMPLVKVGGFGWSGFIDPNRSPGHITMFRTPTVVEALARRLQGLPLPEVAQPLALSEPATLQLTGQATALGMTAGATRHPTSSRANVLGAVEAVASRAVGPAYLPPIEDIEPDHIERLLMLTDGEVVEGDFAEV